MTSQLLADRYEIIEELGHGGMGVVYKARHLLMKRVVAIKMLHESLIANELVHKRFEQEAQAISTLNHPNIMTVYDFGITEDNKPYLVIEYLEGCNLDTVISQVKYMPAERAVGIFKQACAGLGHAHEKGVIHRDIKPSNFMLVKAEDQGDFLKIVDFGIAKLIQEGQKETIGLTTTGEITGSPLYMSPEQCCGQAADVRSDIYSLGAVMYFTLTGHQPFLASNVPECLYKQVHEMPVAFAEANSEANVPPALENIVRTAMDKEPSSRFQSMRDLKQALDYLENPEAGAGLPSNITASSVSQPCPPPPAGLGHTTSGINQRPPAQATNTNSAPPATPPKIQTPLSGLTPRLNSSTALVLVVVGILVSLGAAAWVFSQHNNPVSVFSGYMSQGDTNYDQGNYAQAEKYFSLAFQQAQQLPNGKSALSLATESLCKTFFAEEKYDKVLALAMLQQRYETATDLLNQALSKVQNKYGINSLQAANILSDLAQLYEKQDNYPKSEEYYTKALSIKSAKSAQLLQPESASLVEMKTHLAAVKKRRLQAKRPPAKTQGQDDSQQANQNTASTQQPKKRGIISSVGHGIKKVFSIFGHHDKNSNP